MRSFRMLVAVLLPAANAFGASSNPIPNSQGVYRLPYADGTRVKVFADFITHTPRGRLDLYAVGGEGPYRVVASAAGRVVAIQDNHSEQQDGRTAAVRGGCHNNYVWIEHPNGEWTNYCHLAKDSVTRKAGLKVGDAVSAGQYLGDEGAVGCAMFDHVHFEVVIPDKKQPIDGAGYLTDNADGKRALNPRFCDVPGQNAIAGETYIAGPCGPSHATGMWSDPSPHRVSFVTVEEGVQLEVLDWGGAGRAVVLLAASGWTAHVFDDFTPKLTGRYRVVAITRRGFGSSGFVDGKFGIDLLGDDVLAVTTALKLNRPILVGHSFAGGELSSIATRHPDRVAGAVYLDAAYPVAFDNGKGMSMAEFQEIVHPPPVPRPQAADLASFAALQRYYQQMYGVRLPEAALRQNWAPLPDGRVGKPHSFPGSPGLMMGTRKFSRIPVPALAIFANPQRLGPWLEGHRDPLMRAAVTNFSSKFETYARKQTEAFREAVPAARVLTLAGANHFVFISHEADVLRELDGFIASLP